MYVDVKLQLASSSIYNTDVRQIYLKYTMSV